MFLNTTGRALVTFRRPHVEHLWTYDFVTDTARCLNALFCIAAIF